MSQITTAVVALKTVTLVLGGLITFFAFQAYRRTQASPLRSLAIGFGIVTLGSIIAGVVDQFSNVPLGSALVVESLLTAIGFGVVLYSLYHD
jgi:hypothetical protein